MSKQKRVQLIKKFEKAFADAKYPGDNQIVPLYDNQPHCNECANLAEQFRGKRWQDVPLETLIWERGSLSLFTAVAFCYYLPAFVRAALSPALTDTLWENIFFNLTPPKPATKEETIWFSQRIEGFTSEQKTVLKEYVELYLQTETSYKSPKHRIAKKYWSIE